MRRTTVLACAAAALTGGVALVSTGTGAAEAPSTSYVVLYKSGADQAKAREAVEAAGGRIVSVNEDIGLASVRSSRSDFLARADAAPGVEGAARDTAIGRAPTDATPKADRVEAPQHARPSTRSGRDGARGGDPITDWDMDAIGANATGSYAKQRGSKDVRVGIIDTGVDGNHPDIAPNFDRGLSRNFTTDMPDIDGEACEHPDLNCVDPADEDDDGHGTHVAGTIGAALNGLGMSGVAPDVDLVNIRAGQDSGYFFLTPTTDALTYAGDNGIDVVNMSFYVDPWLFNCTANPADTPAQQAEQRTIIEAVQRSVDYAHDHGVTMVSAAGNDTTDLADKTSDDTSPDYPDGTAHDRTIDNSCLSMPTEANHVLAVSSTGPSGRKAYYSNWGTGQIDVAAPGGDSREFHGTDQYRTVDNLVLAPYPTALGEANDLLAADDDDKADAIHVCTNGTCGYYQYIQGTSMASPHAAGVAALIVAEFGTPDPVHGGLTMAPDAVAARLESSATPKACPAGGTQVYDDPALDPAIYTAACTGSDTASSFFGAGLVNADRAVTRPELGEQVGVPPSASAPSAPAPAAPAAPATELQLISLETSTSFARSGRNTKVRELRVGSSSRGATVRISCSGTGCKGGTRSYPVGEAARSVRGALRTATLRPGAKLTLTVAAPGYRTRRVTYTIRAGRSPSRAVATVG